MRPALDDAPAVEHHDLIGVHDGRESMRDQHGGVVHGDLAQVRQDVLFGPAVERGGGLIVMITLGNVSTETKSTKSGTIPETVFPQQYQPL